MRSLKPFLIPAALLLTAVVPARAQLQPITWTVTSPQGVSAWSENVDAIAFGQGRFVAAGSVTGVINTARIAYSNDLVNWTNATVPEGIPPAQFGQEYFLRSAAYGNGLFIIGAWGQPVANTQKVLTSTDGGLTWTRRDVRLGSVWGLDYLNGIWFATGDSGNATSNLSTSTDGITWTSRTTGSADDLYGVAFGNNIYVAVGNGSQVITSPDGLNWTRRTVTDGGATIHDIVFGNGRFVACAYGGIIYTSTDGLTWTKIDTGTGSNARLESIAFGGGRFVAVGNNTSVSSADGLTWIADSTNLRLTTDVVYGGGVFAVGAGIGTIYRSGTPTIAGPVITAQPASASAVAGGTATFTVGVSGAGNSYQWRKDNVALAGATSATLTLTNITAANAGSYTVVVSNADGAVTSNAVTLTLVTASNVGRLINMSIRTGAGTGDNTLIVGVALGGAGTSGNKAVLLRGVGPTLSAFGVGGALADPVMTVFQGSTQITTNDDWAGGFDFSTVGAFALSGAAPRDAAIYNNAIAGGSYSIQIAGKNNATGIALAEIYDATPTASFSATTPRLVNVSARTQVGTGDNILIAGFVIGGSSPVRVLIRAVGPTLGVFGVGGTLADPKLEIYSGAAKTTENDNWAGIADLKAAFASVAAFAFSADNSRDAALVATLQPGNYTAQVSGVGNTSGVALVELYELP